MPDFRVDSVYNLTAIEEEQAKFLAFLSQSKAAILDLNSQRIIVKTSDVSTFTGASQKLTESVVSSDKAVTQMTASVTAHNNIIKQSNVSLQQNIKNLNDYKSALKDNAAYQKQALKDVEDGKISADEYRVKITQLTDAQFKYRQEITKLSATIKAQTQIQSSAPSSIIQAQAQNKVLTTQRNALPDSDIEGIKALNAQIDRNNELINKNSDLLAKQKINIGNYPNAFGSAFKTLNTELDTVQGKLVSGNFKGQEFDQLTAKLNVLQNAASLTGKEFGTVAQQQKAYAEASTQIGLVYGKNSDVFKQFSAGVKEGNTNIKGLSSEVSNVATKGKGFMGFLSQAYSGIRKLAYAIPGLGIGGIILLLLGPLQAAGAALVKWSNQATKSGRDFQDLEEHIKNTNDVVDKSADSYAKATSEVSKLTEDVQLAKQGFLDKDKVLKEYNDTMGKTTGHLKDFDQLEAKLVADGPDYIQLLFLKAKATAAYALAGEAARKALTAQQDAEKDFGAGDAAGTLFKNFGTVLKSIFGNSNEALADFGQEGAKQINKNAAETKKAQEKAFTDLQNQANDYEKQAAALAKKRGWNFFDPDKTKKEKELKDQSSLLAKYLKKDQDQISLFNEQELKLLLDKYKSEYENQEKSENDRLASLKSYHDAEKALIEKQAQAKRDALKIQQTTDLDKAGDIKNLKLRNKTIAAITKEGIDELKNINSDAQRAQQQNDLQFSKDTIKIVDDGFKKNEQDLKDHISILKQLDEERFAALQQSSENTTNEKGTALISEAQLNEDRRSAGTRQKIEADLQYNLTKLDKEGQLERLQIEDNHNLELAAQANFIEDFDTAAKYEAMITANKKKEAELRKGIIDDEYNYEISKRDKLLELVSQGETQLLEITQAIGDGRFQRQKDDAQKESDLIDSQTQKKIDAVNAEVISDQDKAAKIAIINARAAAEKQALDLKQRKADHDKAEFDKKIAILKIIAQIAIDIAEQKYVPAALAGAALIKLIATPLPAYKHGRGEGKEEMAIVGDGGTNEFIWRQDGKIEKTPAVNTLTHLMPKDRVYPNKESLMRELMFNNMQLSDYSVGQDGGINRNDIERLGSRIENSINDIRIQTQLVTKDGWRNHNERLAKYDAWVERVIKN